MTKTAPMTARHQQFSPWAALFLCASLALSGCEGIKSGLESANQSLQDTFGQKDGEAGKAASSSVENGPSRETVYQDALMQKAAGQATEALVGFETAADMGHPKAAFDAAVAYLEGNGTPKDLERAAHWMTIAADLGEPRALYLAGLNFATGNGVARDYAKAAVYFETAARQGHSAAQYQLAEAYVEGRGVPKDVGWAMRWYGKAAQQGDDKAQMALGVLLAAGTAYPKNLAAGYRWLLLSAEQGNADAAKAVKALKGRLGPKQIKQAEAWAKAFKPGTPGAFADKPTIMYAQDRLNRMGHQAGPVDGVTGARTDRAVRRYRSAKGLTGGTNITADLVDALFEDAHGGS